MLKEIKIPGKGDYSNDAQIQRVKFLENFSSVSLSEIQETNLNQESLKGHIESSIGSVEIPVGVAGPLHIKGNSWEDDIILPLGTTEGALVSSISRGSKLLNLSGGVRSSFISQIMTRVPYFVFDNLDQANKFVTWIDTHFEIIRDLTSKASRFAKLKKIESEPFGKFVHLRFFYSTGDAAGQNMVTLCTKVICEEIMKRLSSESFCPQKFFVDGNGSADKKTSMASILKGRGSKVQVEANISDENLRSVLKVDSDSLVEGFNRSLTSTLYGMPSTLNVNMANVLAAVFGVTGQDLACVGESAQGQIFLERTKEGVYATMVLTNLIVGTVGGGTKLPAQKQMLEFLGCYGEGKVPRFAEIIAGFCLALDLSTFSALVAGHFTRAHMQLGRK